MADTKLLGTTMDVPPNALRCGGPIGGKGCGGLIVVCTGVVLDSWKRDDPYLSGPLILHCTKCGYRAPIRSLLSDHQIRNYAALLVKHRPRHKRRR